MVYRRKILTKRTGSAPTTPIFCGPPLRLAQARRTLDGRRAYHLLPSWFIRSVAGGRQARGREPASAHPACRLSAIEGMDLGRLGGREGQCQ